MRESAPIRIDFISDIVCPWCAIGLASLEQAIARLGDTVEVDLHVQPFELNPAMPREGEPIDAHLARKYGLSPAQLEENRQRLRERGAEVGVDFAARARIGNTFDAHRLLHWAAAEGRQLELKRALMRAYFTDGADVGDPATLARVAGDCGLPAGRAAEILASDEFAEAVRAEEQAWLRAGIHAVPAVVFERRYLVSGGQPAEVFEGVLRQVLASRASDAGAATG